MPGTETHGLHGKKEGRGGQLKPLRKMLSVSVGIRNESTRR